MVCLNILPQLAGSAYFAALLTVEGSTTLKESESNMVSEREIQLQLVLIVTGTVTDVPPHTSPFSKWCNYSLSHR
jgi:hypothetical protein